MCHVTSQVSIYIYIYLGEYIYSPQVGIYIYSHVGWGVYALYATSGAFEVLCDHGIYIYALYILYIICTFTDKIRNI